MTEAQSASSYSEEQMLAQSSRSQGRRAMGGNWNGAPIAPR